MSNKTKKNKIYHIKRTLPTEMVSVRKCFRIVLRICLVYILQCVTIVETLDCRKKAYDFNGKRCCSKCPPGHGMAYDCSHGNDTQCTSCVLGKTYSHYEWHTDKCRNCSECKKDSHVKVKCTLTEDTVCECNMDFFFSNIEKQCLLCNFCPIGFGAFTKCDRFQNSVCYKCPNGTYSDVKSAIQPCYPCTKCSEGQAEFKPCTLTEDTICYGRPEGKIKMEGKEITCLFLERGGMYFLI